MLTVGCSSGTPAVAGHTSGIKLTGGTGHAGSTWAVLPRPASIKLASWVVAVGLAVDPAGGYWIERSDGGVDGFHAPSYGSLADHVPAGSSVVTIAATTTGYPTGCSPSHDHEGFGAVGDAFPS